MKRAKITFIGAGSTIFMKNIIGDILHKPSLKNAHFCLMDIDKQRLEESAIVVEKLINTMGKGASFSTHTDQKEALDNSDFVIVAFQIGGYKPCTVTDFEVCKKYGLEQTIGDTLGVGGIMRALRTVPHLYKICEDMQQLCPNAYMLNYVNPMAINTWAMYAKYPNIKQVGLCHSVPGTIEELSIDLDIDYKDIRYICAGINHMCFYLSLEKRIDDKKGGITYENLYPHLLNAYAKGDAPKPNMHGLNRCENIIRYEMLKVLGYFVTESSEHFAEYTPYFIKPNRQDLIKRYKVPLDEYPKRCEEQIQRWKDELGEYKEANTIEVKPSREYASSIIEAIHTGIPNIVYANVKNSSLIDNLDSECCVEVPCLVDANGVQPTKIGKIPSHLAGLMRTNINVQEQVVEAIINEDINNVYYAALLDPHTSSVLGIEEIYELVDELIKAHNGWLPKWLYK